MRDGPSTPLLVLAAALALYLVVETRRVLTWMVIIGGGPLLEELRARSGPNVELLGSVSRDRIIERLGRARSLIRTHLPKIADAYGKYAVVGAQAARAD